MRNHQYLGRHRATRPASAARFTRAGAVLAASGGLIALTGVPAQANAGGGYGGEYDGGYETQQSSYEQSSYSEPAYTEPAYTEPAAPSATQSSYSASTADQSSTTATVQPASYQPASYQPAASGVLGTAAAYTSSPYVYGGSSPAGFDCSGYTQFVFAQHGIDLPRTTEAQRLATTPVSNPQPGDLVFYGAPSYHVAIYAGDGMIYDAGNPSAGISLRPMFSGVTSFGRIG